MNYQIRNNKTNEVVESNSVDALLDQMVDSDGNKLFSNRKVFGAPKSSRIIQRLIEQGHYSPVAGPDWFMAITAPNSTPTPDAEVLTDDASDAPDASTSAPDTTDVTPAPTPRPIQIGDKVRVKPHTIYRYVVGNAELVEPMVISHPGYPEGVVKQINNMGMGELAYYVELPNQYGGYETSAENITVLDGVLTAGEATEIYGLSPAAVRLAISRGQIKNARKSGGTWLIEKAEAEYQWGALEVPWRDIDFVGDDPIGIWHGWIQIARKPYHLKVWVEIPEGMTVRESGAANCRVKLAQLESDPHNVDIPNYIRVSRIKIIPGERR